MGEKEDRGLFGKRLKEARERFGISQKQLGIRSGLDEGVASPRINRYERGVMQPSDIETAERLAQVLQVPAAFFYARDDLLAEIILLAGNMETSNRRRLLERLRKITKDCERVGKSSA